MLCVEVGSNISDLDQLVYLKVGKSSSLYILITIVITLCSLAGCGRRSQSENAAVGLPRYPIDETLAQAEQLFRQREDVDKLREARRLIAQVREPDNRNFEVEWRFAKYSLFLGRQSTDEQQRTKIFDEGRDAGKMASRIAADRPDGYSWYGANLAELARMSPVTVGYTSVDDIREAMETVIRLQPDYQGASAYDVLAEIELNTRLFGGKASKAAELLEKALEIEKDNSNIRLHLAQAYLDVNKTDLAKQQLEGILKMQPNPEFLPEHKQNVVEAKKLLSTRF